MACWLICASSRDSAQPMCMCRSKRMGGKVQKTWQPQPWTWWSPAIILRTESDEAPDGDGNAQTQFIPGLHLRARIIRPIRAHVPTFQKPFQPARQMIIDSRRLWPVTPSLLGEAEDKFWNVACLQGEDGMNGSLKGGHPWLFWVEDDSGNFSGIQ